MTKEERSEYNRRYREEHRDQINAGVRYRYHHNEKIRERNRKKARKWYQDHKHSPEIMAKKYASNARYRMKKKGNEHERQIDRVAERSDFWSK